MRIGQFTSFIVDVVACCVVTFLQTSMSSSSSSFVAGFSDKYSKLEVSFSPFVDADADDLTRPQVPCVTQKGPKSWICGNGQKLGAAPSFQH
jgi:hypothetical protein